MQVLRNNGNILLAEYGGVLEIAKSDTLEILFKLFVDVKWFNQI